MHQCELRQFVVKAKKRGGIGLPSFCTANAFVIKTILEYANNNSLPVLIESTSHQVNQCGGYSGLTPFDFKNNVFKLAADVGFSKDNILLGGDHLGPLPWRHLPASIAMNHAHNLVRDYVAAGFTKIHLDTSIHLADDDYSRPLDEEIIAARGAALYKTAIDAYRENLEEQFPAHRPVFVIGSEVPNAGGSTNISGHVAITTPHNALRTLEAYKYHFQENAKGAAWQNDIIALVVQPGVEFSNFSVRFYNRSETQSLIACMKKIPGIVPEAHSTDYQPSHLLREMVEDGIGFLKVGPALTRMFLEALQALAHIEAEVVPAHNLSRLFEQYESVMNENDKHWRCYYECDNTNITLAKKYSFLDRRRYYYMNPKIQAAQARLFSNLESCDIPLGLVSQYMPIQYRRFWESGKKLNPTELVKDYISLVLDDYYYACGLVKAR